MWGTLFGQPWETSTFGDYVRGQGTCEGTIHRHLKTSAPQTAADGCLLFQ